MAPVTSGRLYMSLDMNGRNWVLALVEIQVVCADKWPFAVTDSDDASDISHRHTEALPMPLAPY